VATSATTLVQRVRRFLGDWPELDTASASISAGGTSLTVATDATTRYAQNWLIQVDQEMMRVSAVAATTLTVVRGARGTTAASHASGSTILVRPGFSDQDILDSVNAGIDATFPFFYKPILDTSLTADGSSYEYTVPTGLTWLSKVEIKESGSPYYYRIDGWTVKRAASPVLQFATPPIQGMIRCHGFGPLPQLTGFSDSLDTLWPAWGDDPLVEYAAQRLLMSSESQRVRLNAGPQDDAQAPPRQGVTASVAGQLLQRFQMRMAQHPMPPLPRHIVRIF